MIYHRYLFLFPSSKRDEYYMCLGVWLNELFQDEKGCFEITLEKERLDTSCFGVSVALKYLVLFSNNAHLTLIALARNFDWDLICNAR